MTSYPEYSVIGSAVDYADANGRYIFTHHPEGHINEEIQQLKYSICPFIHSSVFYKKDVIVNYGGYNEHAYTYEDHFLWVNLLKNEKACNLSQSLMKVRLNPESVSIDEKWHTGKFRAIKYYPVGRKRIIQAQRETTFPPNKRGGVLCLMRQKIPA